MFEVMATTMATQTEVPVTIVAGQIAAIVKMKSACTIYMASGQSFGVTKLSYADICANVKELLQEKDATA